MGNSFKNLRDRVSDENYKGFCERDKKFISAKKMKELCLNLAGRRICKNLRLRTRN